MIGAAMEAAQLLNFVALTVLIAALMVFLSHVALGLIVLGLGLWLANLAGSAVSATGMRQSQLLATFARIAIIVLAAAMALRAMGLANEIINLAFGLLLGALAVAVALAFGLGGREIAARANCRAGLTRPGRAGLKQSRRGRPNLLHHASRPHRAGRRMSRRTAARRCPKLIPR